MKKACIYSTLCFRDKSQIFTLSALKLKQCCIQKVIKVRYIFYISFFFRFFSGLYYRKFISLEMDLRYCFKLQKVKYYKKQNKKFCNFKRKLQFKRNANVFFKGPYLYSTNLRFQNLGTLFKNIGNGKFYKKA